MIEILIFVAALALVCNSEDTRSFCQLTPEGIENFNEKVVEFVDCVASEKNLDVKWWDLGASNIYFDENPTYKRYAINITAENDKYTNKKPLKSVLHTKTEYAENKMNKPMEMKIQFEDTIHTSTTVSFQKAFGFAIDATGMIGYPVVNLGFKTDAGVNNTRLFNKETNDIKIIAVKKEIALQVGAHSKVTCIFETTEKWEESDWTADLTIRGYIAIRLESPYNPAAIWRQCHPSYPKKVPKRDRKCHTNYKEGKSNVYFYPITNIVQNDPNFKIVKDTIVFKGVGKYKGPVEVSTTNNCNENELKS